MKKYFCDRCKKEVPNKLGLTFMGGHTDGSEFLFEVQNSYIFDKWFCNSCKKEYLRLIKKFMRRGA